MVICAVGASTNVNSSSLNGGLFGINQCFLPLLWADRVLLRWEKLCGGQLCMGGFNIGFRLIWEQLLMIELEIEQ